MLDALRRRDIDEVIVLHDEHRAHSVAAVESMLTASLRPTLRSVR